MIQYKLFDEHQFLCDNVAAANEWLSKILNDVLYFKYIDTKIENNKILIVYDSQTTNEKIKQESDNYEN